MDYKKEFLDYQYQIVQLFVRYLAYFRGLWAARNEFVDYPVFCNFTLQAYLEAAALNWCKVFGSHNEHMHWRKTPTGSTAQRACEDFRRRLLLKTGFTEEQWKDYHRDMRTFRDKFVAHLDMNCELPGGLPHFEPALQVAYAYEEWAKAIEPGLLSFTKVGLRPALHV